MVSLLRIRRVRCNFSHHLLLNLPPNLRLEIDLISVHPKRDFFVSRSGVPKFGLQLGIGPYAALAFRFQITKAAAEINLHI